MICTGDDGEVLSKVSQSGLIRKKKWNERIQGKNPHFFLECVNELSHRRPCVSWTASSCKLNLLRAKGF
jgi:hypothetical protein